MAKQQPLIKRITSIFGGSPKKNAGAPSVAQPTRRSGYSLGLEIGNKVTPTELYVGFARAAIRVITNRFASEIMQNLRAYDSNGKEVSLSKHPIGPVILNPGQGNTEYDIWEQIAINMEVHGRGFMHLLQNKARSKHVALEVLPSDQVSVTEWDDTKMRPQKYEWKTATSDIYDIDAATIIDLKYYNPSDPRQGYSSIASAGDHHITERAAAAHVKNHLYNSGFQNLIVALKETLTPEAFAEFKQDFKQMYTGAASSGKNIFLNGVEAEVKELSSKLSDLDISAIEKVSVDAILASFGVSRAMIGLEGENLNRATAEVQERQLIENVITPLIRRVVSGMNVWTMEQYPQNTITLGFINPSVESVDEELIRAQTMSQKSQSVAVMVAAGIDLDRAMKIAGLEEDGTEQQDSAKNKAMNTVSDDLENAKKNARKNAKSKLTDRKWRLWQREVSEPRIEDAERVLINGLERHYQKLKVKILKQFKKDNAFGVSDVYAIDEASAVASEIRPGLLDLYRLAGGDAMSLMWELSEVDALLQGDFKPSTTLLSRISTLIDKAAKGVSDTNSELIGNIIRDGLAEGKTQTEIAGLIDDAFSGQIEKWRSERLARTEVVRINNLGEQDAVQQWGEIVGAKVYKTWRTNSPEPCEYCRALNGTRKEVGDLFMAQGSKITGTDGGVFQNQYDDMETPPIHPNCACSVTMEVE